MVTYDADTKAQALALAEEYGPAEAARRTGVPAGTIKAWLHRAGRKTGRNPRATATAQPKQKAQPQPDYSPQRDEKGRFLPGYSGNPTGSTSAAQIARREAEKFAPRAIEELKAIALDASQRVYARIEALKELLDRGLGKPRQSIDMDVEGVNTSVNITVLELDAARREILGRIDRLASARGALASAGQGDGDE